MTTALGTSSSVSPKSEPRRTMRRSRALASAIRDLIQQSRSSSATVDDSFGSTTNGHTGGVYSLAVHRPPYMDVQTAKTNLTVDQAAKLEGQTHCHLLVEPVLLPNLGHTGVGRTTLPGDRPLFYPNGLKSCGLGTTIRSALYRSTLDRCDATASDLQQPGGNEYQERQQPQDLPSDWAGSSAYYGPPSDNNSSYDSHASQQRDEVSTSTAVRAEQIGRFPADVWGSPPGEPRGNLYISSSSRRRTKRGPGAGVGEAREARASSQLNSSSLISGSIVDRRLVRYTGIEGRAGEGGRCPSQDCLLAGRTAEVMRSLLHREHHYHLRHQQHASGNNTIPTERLPAEAGAPTAVDRQDQRVFSAPSTGTRKNNHEDLPVSAPDNRGTCSTISDWTTTSPTSARGAILDAGGRDSEWLAERRAADREAKEVLSALKQNSTRLAFLVGSECR